MSATSETLMDRLAKAVFIGACLVLTSVALLKFSAGPPTQEARPSQSVGTELAVTSPFVDVGRRTVLILVTSRCRYCLESIPTYAGLLERASSTGSFRVVFTGPEPPDTVTAFLEANGLSAPTVLSMPEEIPFTVTPTLLVIEASGRISAGWEGQLSASQERDLARAVS